MRIISGKHKGRAIQTIKDKKLRPTTSMTREGLYNVLSHGKFAEDGQNIIVNSNILDLFCGCGALSLEAISRGAAHATLIDIDQQHLDIARRNFNSIGEIANASFIRADSSTPPPAKKSCNIVFIDPPYGKNLVNPSLKSIVAGGWLANNAVVIIETGKNEDIEFPDSFSELDDRTYGNCRIRILRWLGD